MSLSLYCDILKAYNGNTNTYSILGTNYQFLSYVSIEPNNDYTEPGDIKMIVNFKPGNLVVLKNSYVENVYYYSNSTGEVYKNNSTQLSDILNSQLRQVNKLPTKKQNFATICFQHKKKDGTFVSVFPENILPTEYTNQCNLIIYFTMYKLYKNNYFTNDTNNDVDNTD